MEKGGDYLFQIKGNQPNLLKQAQGLDALKDTLFVRSESGHGRVQTWGVHPFAIEPLTADFPYARSLIVVRSERTIKKSGQSSTESRYYLSSAMPKEYTPAQWLELIRGHWGGVENRNHWRRDALMGEDRSRSRNVRLLANVALIRNALLQLISERLEEQSLPQLRESLYSSPARCLALLARS